MRASNTPSVPALVRGLTILERIARSRRGLTFAQLTRLFDFPKSSVHTLLLTLEREGWVQRDTETARYMVGTKIVDLAGTTVDGVVLREKAAPLLHALAAELDMTTHLAVLDRDAVAVIAKIERAGRPQVATWIGKRVDVHCTSLGKCLIAYLNDEHLDRLIGTRRLLRHNENTIVSPALLKRELARVRAADYAFDDEEEEIGIRCIGAPIFNWEGTVAAAVSVTGSVGRINAETIEAVAQRVKHTAHAISHELGYARDSAPANPDAA
ncbi:MAG: IclR family transcriptional regulator [Vicinamibacterales bacterium]